MITIVGWFLGGVVISCALMTLCQI